MHFFGGLCGAVVVAAVLGFLLLRGKAKRWPPCPTCQSKLTYEAGLVSYSAEGETPLDYLSCSKCRARWVVTGGTQFAKATPEEWTSVVVNKPD